MLHGLYTPTRLFVLLLCLGAVPGALADIVENLYGASERVEDQSQRARKIAAKAALAEVFTRVSGQRSPALGGDMAAVLANPESLITKYNYRTETDALGETTLLLDISFSPRQVNAVLQSAGLPVWTANRPAVLVWLLVDTAQGRSFVGGSAEELAYQALEMETRRRGLALQFPLFDLVDTGNLDQEQLWRLSVADVIRASERYNAEYVLMGRASELSSGQWLASWVMLENSSQQRLETQGGTAAEAFSAAIDMVADSQAQRYAISGGVGAESGAYILVEDVDSFDDYARLLAYLEGLAIIRHANPVWVLGSHVVLELVASDSQAKVARFIELDGRLKALASTAMDSPASLPVTVQGHYQWQGR